MIVPPLAVLLPDERIAEAEPFFAQRLRTFELREWTVMEGALGVPVNLSDQSVEVA